jgi:hypothetical protein
MPKVNVGNDPTKLPLLPRDNAPPAPDANEPRVRRGSGAGDTNRVRSRSNSQTKIKVFSQLSEKQLAWKAKKAEKAEKAEAKKAEKEAAKRLEPTHVFWKDAKRAAENPPGKSNLNTPTERTNNLSVMSQGKSVEAIQATLMSKNEGNVDSNLEYKILAAVEKYNILPKLLGGAIKKNDYSSVTEVLLSLMGEDKKNGCRGAFAEAVLIRVFLKLDAEELRDLGKLQGQEFVNSVPQEESEEAHREAQTKAATAVNILQNAIDKRMKDVPVKGGDRPAPQVGFKEEDNTMHRYRQVKPSVSASRAIVNMTTAVEERDLAKNKKDLSENEKELAKNKKDLAEKEKAVRKATNRLGDSLEWLMDEPKSGKRIEALLKDMPRRLLHLVAEINVEEVVERLRKRADKYPGPNDKGPYVKSRYDDDQLAIMKEQLISISNRAYQLIHWPAA